MLAVVVGTAMVFLWSGLEGAELSRTLQPAVALALGLPVILAVTTLVHEVGHAAAGLVLGFEVRSVIVGQGPRLLALRTGEVTWELRLVPVNGFTTAYLLSPKDWARRWTLFSLAGPGATALLLAAVLLWHPRDTPIAGALFIGWVVMNALMLASTALPLPHSGLFDNDVVSIGVERSRPPAEIHDTIVADGTHLVYEMADRRDFEGAIRLSERLRTSLPDSADLEALVVYSFAAAGRRDDARMRLMALAQKLEPGHDLHPWVDEMEEHLG